MKQYASIALGGIIILLVGALWYFAPFSPTKQTAIGSDVRILVQEGSEQALVEFRNGVREQVISDVSGIVSYDRADGTEVVIVANDGLSEVRVRTDGDWQVINSSPFAKAAAAVSGDGRYVAYAEQTLENSEAREIANWRVSVFDIESGDTEEIPFGSYAPQFRIVEEGGESWQTLFFTIPDGVGIHRLGTETVLFSESIVLEQPRVEEAFLLTPNGKYLVRYDVASDHVLLFDVDELASLTVTAPRIVSGGPIVGLTNTEVFLHGPDGVRAIDIPSGEIREVELPVLSDTIISITHIQ